MRNWFNHFSAGILCLSATCCTPSHSNFMAIQMCLLDDAGITQFIDEMRSAASAEGMNFVDRSAESEKELEDNHYQGVEISRGARIINISGVNGDGLSFGATNLGLQKHQVVVGFSYRYDILLARQFSDRIMARLKRHWAIEPVAAGTGAKPMQNCN